MSATSGLYGFKNENSPSSTVIKNTPLAASEISYPALFCFERAKKKSTKGDTASLTEVQLTVFMPKLSKFLTAIWSVWSDKVLFVTMLEQVKRDSTDEKPLLLYSENGWGKNNLYEVIFQVSNKYSVFSHPDNEDISVTAQVRLLL